MAETTDELLARMAAKYGLPSAPPPQQPAPQPPAPQPQPEKRGLIDTLRNRGRDIDKAVNGYANGGQIIPVDIGAGLKEAIVDPIVNDIRQGNRTIQKAATLASNAAQMLPVVGIPTAGLNYADAMERGDTSGAIAASLSAIPVAERAYHVGSNVARSLREFAGQGGFRRTFNEIGRRFGAGEQAAEAYESGRDQAAGYAKGGKICGMANGGKIQGPGTPTSDSIQANVEETGEPIQVSTGERLLYKAQDGYLSAMAKKMGFNSLDAMLEHGTGQPVGPTVKGGKRAAATGMSPDEVIRATRTPFNYDEFAKQQIARSMAADAAAASGAGATPPAAPAATQTATTFSRGAGLLGDIAKRIGSFNPGGPGAVMLGSAVARGIDDAINAARTAGQDPYRPSALVNQIPMEGPPKPSADTSNYGNEGRGISALSQATLDYSKTVPAAPDESNYGNEGRGTSAAQTQSVPSGNPPERSVMDIYKNASDIQAQQIEQPTQAGIIRNTQADDRRAFDNFVNRTTLQSAINSAITQNTPRSLASIANLENAQTALAGQIPRQELKRDTLEQQGDLRRRALDQEARYKGGLLGVQQDEAKAKGLLANYAGLEQQAKAATNALKRQSTQMDIVQKQLMQGYLNTFNDPKATDAQKAEAIRAIYAMQGKSPSGDNQERSEERRVGKECRSRWSP